MEDDDKEQLEKEIDVTYDANGKISKLTATVTSDEAWIVPALREQENYYKELAKALKKSAMASATYPEHEEIEE